MSKEDKQEMEGSYSYYNGCIATHCSVWNIVNDREDRWINKFIKRIGKRNKNQIVTVTISLANVKKGESR